MTDEQRAAAMKALAPRITDLIGAELRMVPGLTEGDALSVGVSACIGVAVSLASVRAVDAKAAVALITCLAEAVAEDIYGSAG